jgi:hypothetical protein
MRSLTTSDLRRAIKLRLLALPPRAFELFAGDLLEFMGLHNVSVTRYSGDGGIDACGDIEVGNALIRIPTGVQVKRYRANVQRADIDRFIGALSGRYSQGIFITTSGYTPQAAEKAKAAVPRVAPVDGDQVVALMLQHRLGIAEGERAAGGLDEEYFGQYEAQAAARPARLAEKPGVYRAGEGEAERAARPEDDLISLRALGHALRVDATARRRRLEQGPLRAELDMAAARGGYFFRRDRVETIRAALLGPARPASPEQWRQEFLDFARSRNLTKSYKPVLIKALLQAIDRNGEARIDAVVQAFRAFYQGRRLAGLPVEFGPPDLADARAVDEAQLRQLIVRNPLERFLIKGFLEYLPAEGLVRFAPQLWGELRAWELLAVQQSADEQLAYYYSRGSR